MMTAKRTMSTIKQSINEFLFSFFSLGSQLKMNIYICREQSRKKFDKTAEQDKRLISVSIFIPNIAMAHNQRWW